MTSQWYNQIAWIFCHLSDSAGNIRRTGSADGRVRGKPPMSNTPQNKRQTIAKQPATRKYPPSAQKNVSNFHKVRGTGGRGWGQDKPPMSNTPQNKRQTSAKQPATRKYPPSAQKNVSDLHKFRRAGGRGRGQGEPAMSKTPQSKRQTSAKQPATRKYPPSAQKNVSDLHKVRGRGEVRLNLQWVRHHRANNKHRPNDPLHENIHLPLRKM